MGNVKYDFVKDAAIAINSGQASSLILHGNIYDLFFNDGGDANKEEYLPLLDFLSARWDVSGIIIVVYDPSGRIRIQKPENREKLKAAWTQWKSGMSETDLAIKEMLSINKLKSYAEEMNESFDRLLKQAEKDPVTAIDILRQLCACSRSSIDGKAILKENLIIIIDEADMVFPESDTSGMSYLDRKMTGMCTEWFSDPLFFNGKDAVIMVSESKSSINSKITRLPHLVSFEVAYPNEEARAHYISWFNQRQPRDRKIKLWGTQRELAKLTGGLSMHALRRLLVKSCHLKEKVQPTHVIAHIEHYIKSQLKEDVVEFKKPEHTLKQVIGFSSFKTFLKREFIPRLKSSGPDAISGAAVCGAIGSGKTFIFEAVANEADMLVLVLKNIRSQWFGQTDVLFERLRRLLISLEKVLIMVDEADTQFGGLGSTDHPTEKRLVGNIQQMMSDPKLRGKVKWLLMTARIHRLSPDIRRPGRAGDLIIPIFDPEGDDREKFVRWILEKVIADKKDVADAVQLVLEHTKGYSAAAYASIRAELLAQASREKLSKDDVVRIIADIIPSDIRKVREYQTLQALINCTRKSLIPDHYFEGNASLTEIREQWTMRIQALEAEGIG